MQYSVLSVLMLIRLIYSVAGQSPPPPSSTTPTPTPGGTTPTSTTGGPSTTSTPDSCPNPNTPSSTTPSPGSTTPNPSSTTPGSTSPTPTPGSGGGTGTDNMSCIKNLLSLCEAYRFQFKKTANEYGCTMFTNTYIYTFHINLVLTDSECDTIMQLDTMRQKVMGYGSGQPGVSTHAFIDDSC
ncbi:uncharacterized protein LOC135844741 [Planococcus citri]|uniref:uncharacterized protein LOC135844741 n=1 Tax=Planococcus citri TaxID=170843 RepID=UPI0031F8BF2E